MAAGVALPPRAAGGGRRAAGKRTVTAVLWVKHAPAASAAPLFLLGLTFVGYFAANVILALIYAVRTVVRGETISVNSHRGEQNPQTGSHRKPDSLPLSAHGRTAKKPLTI